MRVAMFLTPPNPFGADWAEAARHVADVVTMEIVPKLTMPQLGVGVAGDGSEYQIERFALRPTRLFLPVTARVIATRIDRCLTVAAAQHGKIDVLHTHFYSGTRPIRHLRSDIPYVHTEHASSLTPHAADHKQLSRVGHSMARRGIGDASVAIAVSEYLRSCISERGLGDGVRIIPNPVDVELFTPAASRDPHRLVWVGRIEPDKRPDVLLRGFALAHQENPALTLEIIGSGPGEAAAQKLATELGVEGAVKFCGRLRRDQVAARVATSAAFLNTSRVETFGVAVAEALAAGVPVVAPDSTALPELVNSSNGILFRPGDPVDLAVGISVVLAGTYDPETIAGPIRSRASSEAVGMALMECYETACQ